MTRRNHIEICINPHQALIASNMVFLSDGLMEVDVLSFLNQVA